MAVCWWYVGASHNISEHGSANTHRTGFGKQRQMSEALGISRSHLKLLLHRVSFTVEHPFSRLPLGNTLTFTHVHSAAASTCWPVVAGASAVFVTCTFIQRNSPCQGLSTYFTDLELHPYSGPLTFLRRSPQNHVFCSLTAINVFHTDLCGCLSEQQIRYPMSHGSVTIQRECQRTY